MKEITLTAVFEGTIFHIEQPESHLHQVLNNYCDGTRIHSAEDLEDPQNFEKLKMGFSGCAVTNGVLGMLFGVGLDKQVDTAVTVVKKLIKDGYKVKLNAIGLSRGGVASILLAKKLSAIDSIHLETNLLLLDPVPGNFLLTPYLDIFGWTLAKQSMDVSDSRNLKNVKALYPYLEAGEYTKDPIDDIVAYLQIPLRPLYPPQCNVTEEVILGAHLTAFRDLENNEFPFTIEGRDIAPIIKSLSKEIICKFLKDVGSLSPDIKEEEWLTIASKFNNNKEEWSSWLKDIIKHLVPRDRNLFSLDNSRISISNEAEFLCQTHREVTGSCSESPDELCLKVTPARRRIELIPLPISIDELSRLITIIESGMTPASKQGKKGEVLTKIKSQLTEPQIDTEFTEEQLSSVLRNILAVALQRTSCKFSFFTHTNCGEHLVKNINRREFAAVCQRLRPDGNKINYQDLTEYVLGANVVSHFNSQHCDGNLVQIELNDLGADNYSAFIC